MKNIAVLAFICAVLVSSVAFGGKTLVFNGATEADLGTTNLTAESGGPYWSGDSGVDRTCYTAGLVFVTNDVSYYSFHFGAPGSGTILRVMGPSGNLSLSSYSAAYLAENATDNAVFEICSGANYNGCIHAGCSGYGVVTNNGNWKVLGVTYLGVESGSHGVLVHNGTVSIPNARQLYVGVEGLGELIINQPLNWAWYTHETGDIIVGQSSQTNRIVITPEGYLMAKYLYLGGRTAGQAGHGELQLRGGTYFNKLVNNDREDQLYLGACTNETGAIDPASYGAIRGWGSLAGSDQTYHVGYRGLYIRMGYGEIVGDGEGDESCLLTGTNAVQQVTNVLFGVVTESGWRAVNKGSVELARGGGGSDYGSSECARCVGCARDLETPDLVNAVRISCKGMASSYKSPAARVLAPDRTDAHTNALPERVCNVLSVHRMGVFKGVNWTVDYDNRMTVPSYKVAIRYDQTKLHSNYTRLELLRYSDTSGKWTNVASIEPGDRPDNCVISTDDWKDASDSADELYTMGTFAVVESAVSGFLVIMR